MTDAPSRRSGKSGAGDTGQSNAELRRNVEHVVRAGNCSGCGACALLSDAITMKLDDDGYQRPVWRDRGSASAPGADKDFAAVCPGMGVSSARCRGLQSHPTLGPHVSAWTAWASDPAIRFAGSSGGVLTALSAWMLETGAPAVVGVTSCAELPSRTVALELKTKDDVLAAAGSRYAPVAAAAAFDPRQSDRAFVGKPCEIYAARQMISRTVVPGQPQPVLLSFFCAGVPSQKATERLIDTVGMELAEVSALRYRGNGWPGNFVVHDTAGRSATVSYEESWGKHLGPHVQSRCKICPDGTGEHADITVGDFWRTGPSGYPAFEDADGMSVAIARTPRGHRLLLEAASADVLVLGSVDLDAVAAVQPLQVKRLTTLLGRLLGRLIAGKPIPRYRGFGLARRALRHPVMNAVSLRGTFGRTRRSRRVG